MRKQGHRSRATILLPGETSDTANWSRNAGDFGWRRKRWFLLIGLTIGVGILGFGLARRLWPPQSTPPPKKDPSVASRQGSLAGRPARRESTIAPVEMIAPPKEPIPALPEPDLVPAETSPAVPEPISSTPQPAPAPEAEAGALKNEVLEVIRRLSKDFPNRVEPLVLMGNVHQRLGNSSEAVKCWEKCLELDPHRADVLSGMASLAFQQEAYERAAALWKKALSIHPSEPGAYNGLGRVMMSLGRLEEAAAALEKDLQISPRSSGSYFLLGQTYLQLKEYKKAKRNYEAAIKIRPDFWNAYYGLFRVCAKLGQTEKSREYREKFKTLKSEELKVAIDRNNALDDLNLMHRSAAQIYTDAGQLYRKYGDLRTAETHWQRAAALDAKNTACRTGLALLYQSTGRIREAVRRYEQLRELQPNNPIPHLNLGLLYTQSKRHDAAEEAFRTARDLAPQSSSGYRELARLYLLTKQRFAEAQALARKAVELEPTAPNYYVLSWACDRNGDPAGAISAMKQAVELDPDNARYRRKYELIRQRK